MSHTPRQFRYPRSEPIAYTARFRARSTLHTVAVHYGCIAAILWLEAFFRHFDNRRQLASYAGLADRRDFRSAHLGVGAKPLKPKTRNQ
jgi:hypothetical protein